MSHCNLCISTKLSVFAMKLNIVRGIDNGAAPGAVCGGDDPVDET